MTNSLTTAVSGPPGAATQPRPPAAPPNPKQQAVTFALELAKIRATLPGANTTRGTDVDQLIADATAIAAFIGQSTTATRLPDGFDPNSIRFRKTSSG